MTITSPLRSLEITSHKARSQYYSFLDHEFNQTAGGDVGVDSLIGSQPFVLSAKEIAGFRNRYHVIRRFQKTTLELFLASLRGEEAPWIAELVLGDVPKPLAHSFHQRLQEAHLRLPVFFRTDEPAPGILSEIQCPGSGWSNHELLWVLYDEHPDVFGQPETFSQPLSKYLADDLRLLLAEDPRVYYMLDNASLPHGARYFIQKTRHHGVRYYSWDPELHPRFCNFVRSHDWISLLHNNFYESHLQSCLEGELRYDLSPMALFDSKTIMVLPFEKRTRNYYDDEVRSIFPFTQILRPEGAFSAEGKQVSLETLCKDASLRRNVYLKYAGTDVNLNWGSRAVFSLKNSSISQAGKLLERALADGRKGRPWILQQAHRQKNCAEFISRDGHIREHEGYLKLSGFYGPSGLLGIIAYHLRSAKVHGNSDAILSAVY